MSTPFPPNSKLKGLSVYAPPRVRDRALSVVPAETQDTSAQTETTQPEAEPPAEGDPTPAVKEANSANEAGAAADDPLDWIEDAIRAVVALKHTPDGDGEFDPSVSAASSPSITPLHDENDDWPQSGPRRRPPRLATEIVPPPPPPKRDGGRSAQILRVSLAIVFAAIVAYGVTLFYPFRPSTPQSTEPSRRAAEATPHQMETQAAPGMRPHLIVGDQQAFANEPVSPAVKVEQATGTESLLFDGLARGTTLSAGTSISPSSWRLPPDKLSGLYLYAPKDFVGVMNTTVNLLGPDNTLLDSRDMHLKWISRPPQQASQPTVASAGHEVPADIRRSAAPPEAPAVKSIDPGQAALLMQRGRDSLDTGDISAARVAFRRLADAGMPDAALALANTYDPTYLAAHNVVGVLGDPAMARTLYQRAKDLGSAEASRILADMAAQ